jgi:hypothetical protein
LERGTTNGHSGLGQGCEKRWKGRKARSDGERKGIIVTLRESRLCGYHAQGKGGRATDTRKPQEAVGREHDTDK